MGHLVHSGFNVYDLMFVWYLPSYTNLFSFLFTDMPYKLSILRGMY